MDVRSIPISEILPDPDQPRKEFDPIELGQLAASLKDHGQDYPIKVRFAQAQGKWMIVDGERRWRAAAQAGLETLNCLIEEGEPSGPDLRLLQVRVNDQHAHLSPADKARVYRELMETNGWGVRELARELNLAPSTVSRSLKAGVASRNTPGVASRNTDGARGVASRNTPGRPRKKKPPHRLFRLSGGEVLVQPRKRTDAAGVLKLLEEATAKQRSRLRVEAAPSPLEGEGTTTHLKLLPRDGEREAA